MVPAPPSFRVQDAVVPGVKHAPELHGAGVTMGSATALAFDRDEAGTLAGEHELELNDAQRDTLANAPRPGRLLQRANSGSQAKALHPAGPVHRVSV